MPYNSGNSYGYYPALGYIGANAKARPGIEQKPQRGLTTGLEGALELGLAREASREVRKDGRFS